MIRDTIAGIENRIKKADAISEDKKKELLELLSVLSAEIVELSRTQREHAESIKGFTELSAHEATRESGNPELLKIALDGLSSSVNGFEVSHPKLVDIVNSTCIMLANIGI